MTFDQYIKNPMGGSVVTNRQVLMDSYHQRWEKILVRENGNIDYTLYTGKDDYYVYAKIPSEVVPKFYYDVVVRFYVDKNKTSGNAPGSLSAYDVQFYSNDPNFVYTFTHAFKAHNMFINDLRSKTIKLCLEKKAVEKNPRDEIGYVKSLVFLYFVIKDLNLFQKSQYGLKAKPYSPDVWKTVTNADDKITERQEKGAKIQKKDHSKTKVNSVQRNTSGINPIAHIFSSPNPKNFGHFKKTDYNKLSLDKIKNIPNNIVNGIKKSFK